MSDLGTIQIKRTQDGWRYSWDNDAAVVTIENITESGDDITAEVTISTTLPPIAGVLAWGRTNISSITSRSAIVRAAKQRLDSFDWEGALLQASYHAVKRFRRGERLQDLAEITPSEQRWILYPYLESGGPSVLFAAGGSCKSVLALAMCMSMATGRPIVGKPHVEPCNALYLDWETDGETHAERLRALQRGSFIRDLGPGRIFYKFMSAALPDAIPQLRREVRRHDIRFIVVDSISYAAGGDINEAECATHFYRSLRGINAWWLLVGHMRKAGQGMSKDDGASLYGSVYWFNGARMLWQVEALREEESPIVQLRLAQQKANNTMRARQHGFELQFVSTGEFGSLDSIRIRQLDLTQVPEFAEKLTWRQRITRALKNGAKSREELAEEFGVDTKDEKAMKALDAELSRLSRNGIIIRLQRGVYGLPEWAQN
jgi:hypothetical protein